LGAASGDGAALSAPQPNATAQTKGSIRMTRLREAIGVPGWRRSNHEPFREASSVFREAPRKVDTSKESARVPSKSKMKTP
jgi:hypothetical protein